MLKVKQPAHDWIQVQPIEAESPSGIVVPSIGRKTPQGRQPSPDYQYAIVLQVGPGGIDNDGKLIPMCCEVGDKVVYSDTLKYFHVGMKKTYWLRNIEVVCVLEEVPDETDLKEAPREAAQSSN